MDKELIKRVTDFLSKEGITQKALADKANVHESVISRIVNDRRGDVTASVYLRIMSAIGDGD